MFPKDHPGIVAQNVVVLVIVGLGLLICSVGFYYVVRITFALCCIHRRKKRAQRDNARLGVELGVVTRDHERGLQTINEDNAGETGGAQKHVAEKQKDGGEKKKDEKKKDNVVGADGK